MSGFLECGRDDRRDFVLPDLYCPHGHLIKWEFAFHEAGYPRCTERGRDGRAMCNARLFVQFFPRLNKTSRPLVYVAEIMTYLGLGWSPTKA